MDLPLLFPGPTLAVASATEPTALRLAASVAAVRELLVERLSLCMLDSEYCKAACSLSRLACSASNTRSSSFIISLCSLRSWCTWPTCFCTGSSCGICAVLGTLKSSVTVTLLKCHFLQASKPIADGAACPVYVYACFHVQSRRNADFVPLSRDAVLA
jgi:hypothetical protein